MAKQGFNDPNISIEDKIGAAAFIAWLQKCKGVTTDQQLQAAKGNEKLHLEFYLISRYLGHHKTDSSNANVQQYFIAGNYNYKDQIFNGLLHYVSVNKIADNPNLNFQIFQTILKDWQEAGRSFDIQDNEKLRPVDLAVVQKNIAFVAALKEVGYPFDGLDAWGFSPIAKLVTLINKGDYSVEHLKEWIKSGLPINTPCSKEHNFYTALDFAKGFKNDSICQLLQANGAISRLIEFPEEISRIDDLYEVWRQYYLNYGDDNLEQILKIKCPKPHEKVKEFKEYFKCSNRLLEFVEFTRQSENVDSSVIQQFEPLVEGVKEAWADNPDLVHPQITGVEAELIKGYLWKLPQHSHEKFKECQQETKKIKAGEFNKINLHNNLYETLLSYCVLNLDMSKEGDIDLFKGLLNKVGAMGLRYAHGNLKFDGRNLCMISDLTPLNIAIKKGGSNANKMACILAEHGYGTKMLDYDAAIVHAAALEGNIELLEMLRGVPGVDFNAVCKESVPLIQPLLKCSQGELEKYKPVVAKLVELGANINYQDHDKDSILHLFARSGVGFLNSLEVAKDVGADFSIANKDGDTVIMHAMNNGQLQIAEWFLENDIGATDRNELMGYTTLHLLAKAGMHERIKQVIEQGADIYAKDNANDESDKLSVMQYAMMPMVKSQPTGDNETIKDNFLKTARVLFEHNYKLSDADRKSLRESLKEDFANIEEELEALYEQCVPGIVTKSAKSVVKKPDDKNEDSGHSKPTTKGKEEEGNDAAAKEADKATAVAPSSKGKEPADMISLALGGDHVDNGEVGISGGSGSNGGIDPALTVDPMPNPWG